YKGDRSKDCTADRAIHHRCTADKAMLQRSTADRAIHQRCTAGADRLGTAHCREIHEICI
ncbi:hypothetical protein, partial [Eshraghiella crossota]|uniref:hypothetical protein n=1 Tax=Eshraghiella crossota TaxID=45851 RepID=UPI003F7F0466